MIDEEKKSILGEKKGGGGGDDDREKKFPIGDKGGTVDDAVCELCGEYHQPVYLLRKDDNERPDHFLPLCSPSITLPALYTMCSLGGKVARDDSCCMDVAEHAIRFMLTQGAKWVNTDQNQRAKMIISTSSTSSSSTSTSTSSKSSGHLERKKEITEIPATTIEEILKVPEKELTTEPLMIYFQKFLKVKTTKKRWAGLNALWTVSTNNLKQLRIDAGVTNWQPRQQQLFQLLLGFNLSLTHYADRPRGYQPEKKEVKQPKKKVVVEDEDEPPPSPCTLALYSRVFLDCNAEALGIKGYPKGNTPSMAFKNIGHVDYVFFAIEPRQGANITKPLKVGSRFGRFCHMIDFDQLPAFAIMTLGDLDTCNAKIGVNRLTHGSDKETGASLGFCAQNVKTLIHKEKCTLMVTNETDTQASQTIYVRSFTTRSEQIFVKEHIKEALALKVFIDCMNCGFLENGWCEANPTAADYNCLINGLFVPQIMVPRAFCTDQAFMFEGEISQEEIKKMKEEKIKKYLEKDDK